MGTFRGVLSGVLALALLLPLGASAAAEPDPNTEVVTATASTLVVNTTTDRQLQDGDVDCVDPARTCSLRAAVQEANANAAYDTIMVPAGGYVLTRAGTSADGSSGALRVASDMTIVGAGAGLTVIDAGWRSTVTGSGTGDRVVDVVSGSSTIEGATVRGGVAPGGSLVEDRGGGIHVRTGASLTLEDSGVDGNRAVQGGGIHSAGTLRLVRSEVRDNRSSAQGGGIHASGPVELARTLVASNSSGSLGGGLLLTSPTSAPVRSSIVESTVEGNTSGNAGGGIAVGSGAQLELVGSTVHANSAATSGGAFSLVASGGLAAVNSTISGNTATNGTGGILSSSSVSPRLQHVTIAGNSRSGSGASALQVGTTSAQAEIESSILTAATGVTPICVGAVVSTGYNLGRDESCQLTQATDQQGTDPQLGPLADNGGPTSTHLPLSASPVIDAGPTVIDDCLTRDQRGAVRPAGPRCDTGSVEFGATFPDAPDPDAEVPGAPGEILTRVGDGTIGLAWQPPADDGGAPITAYEVAVDPAATDGSSTVTFSEARGVVTNLANGTEYTFAVRAVNDAGPGPASQPVSVTPEFVWQAVGLEGSIDGRSARWDPPGQARTALGSMLVNSVIPFGIAQGSDGRWVAVGHNGRASFSDDGRTWQDASAGVPTNQLLRSVAEDGAGRWVAVGHGGTVLTSTDGATWTAATAPAGSYLDVAYGGGRWVAVGTSGLVATSTSGVTWTTAAYPHAGSVRRVAYGGGSWVAAGDSGQVATSATGTSWSAASFPTTDAITGLAHGDGRWVAVAAPRRILSSLDGGASWEMQTVSSLNQGSLLALHHQNGIWLAVGHRIGLRSVDGTTWTITRNEFSGPSYHDIDASRQLLTPPPALPSVVPDPEPEEIEARLVGLEVNQAVQDWRNTVPLFSEKATAVRAFVEVPDATSPMRLSGVLRGYRLGEELPWSPLPPVNAAGAIAAGPDIVARRADLDASLNFRLPFSWLNGDLELVFETPKATLACQEQAPPTSTCRADVSFLRSGTLDASLVDVGWRASPDVPVIRPTAVDLAEQKTRLRETFPISRYAQNSLRLATPFNTKPTDSEVLAALRTQRELDGCRSADGCNRIYSSYLIGSGGGLASGAVSTSWGSGSEAPTARNHARNRVPHEIAHNLGVPHVVNESNGLDEDGTKVGWCGEEAPAAALDWPHTTTVGTSVRPTLGPMGGVNSQIWGLVPRFLQTDARLALVDPSTTFPMMSYCVAVLAGQGRWMSSPTYQTLHDRIGLWGVAGATAQQGAIVAAADATVDQLLVRVTVPLEEGAQVETVEFDPVLRASLAPPAVPVSGDYELVLRGVDGEPIVSVPFDVEELHADGGADPGIGQAIVAVPAPEDAVGRIEVVEGDAVVATLQASPSTPVVVIDAPEPGSVIGAPDTAVVRWTGTDDDGDDLVYTVRVSSDDGITWETVAVDVTATELELPLPQLRATTTARLQVIASDGVNSGVAEVGPLNIVDQPPQVSIVHPLAGETFAGEQLLTLSATAVDPEDGELDGDAVRWTSDIDGPVGAGTEVTVPAADLTEGEHELTVTATDTAGASAAATVRVFVSRTYAPLATEPLPVGSAGALQVTDAVVSVGVDELFDVAAQVIDAVGDPVELAGTEVTLTRLGGDPRLEPTTATASSDDSGVVALTGLRLSGSGGTALLELTSDGLPATLLEIDVDGPIDPGGDEPPDTGGEGPPASGGGTPGEPGADVEDPEPSPLLDCDLVTPVSFTDVSPSSTHGTAIGCLAGIDVLLGRGDGTFVPTLTLTRGQAASMVFRSLQSAGLSIGEVEEVAFDDIADSVHAGAISALAGLGIVQGRTDNTYEPLAPVTRAQLVSLIVRAAATLGADTSPVSQPFDDVAGSVHADSIRWAVDVGIAEGFSDGTFRPNISVTRQQSASFVVRWLSTVHREAAELP